MSRALARHSYIVTGFFEQQPLQRQLNNVECNAVAGVAITHHFLKKLIDKNLKGCIVFTSSVSGYIPNPFATMYGATKAFVSQFAASLAVEVGPLGTLPLLQRCSSCKPSVPC